MNKIKFNEISTFKYGSMVKNFSQHGYPVFSGYQITGYFDKYMYETEKLLIIARGVGGIGKVCIAPSKSWITNLSIICDVDEQKANIYYLFYYLTSEIKRLKKLDTGSCQSQITTEDLSRFELIIPDIIQQKKIANILKSIDTKISTNNAIASELEAMAKLIYDYWFVQFDFPDENGRPYKSSGGKMVWNEELKREIPEGWEVSPLEKVFEITMGSSPTGNSFNTSRQGIEFYQGATDFGKLYPDERVYTTSPVRFAKAQDILLSVRAPVGAMNIAMNDCCIGRGLAAIHHISSLYAYNTILTLKTFFEFFNGNGTTFGALTSDDLKKQIISVPSHIILNKYIKLTAPISKKLRELSIENRKLVSLRDFLLPMLMNGQVKIQ